MYRVTSPKKSRKEILLPTSQRTSQFSGEFFKSTFDFRSFFCSRVDGNAFPRNWSYWVRVVRNQISNANFDQFMPAILVGFVEILYQIVQRWKLQLLVHQIRPPTEANGTKLGTMNESQNYVIEILLRHSSSSWKFWFEIDWKSAQARYAIGQIYWKYDGLHAFDWQGFTDHGLGCVH